LAILHLVLHWNWAKVNFNKYLRIEPKILAMIVVAIVIFCGVVAPIYLTKDFSNQKSLKDAYRSSYSIKVGGRGYSDE
jgi:hypothetical protein